MKTLACIKKFTALITAASFIVSVFSSGGYAAYASALPAEKTNVLEQAFNTVNIIPLSLGKVTGVSNRQSGTVIVNIQDLHSHAEIQRNIAGIIKIIDENSNLTAVHTEGGVGNIDVSWINNIENAELKSKIIEQLLNGGDLSAGEYYAMTSGKNVALKGLENKKIHAENIARLAEIESNREVYLKILSKTDKEISILNKMYTGSRNIRFNNVLLKHSQGKLNDSKFYALLGKYVENINSEPQNYNNTTKIDFKNYPNIAHYLVLTNLSSRIDSQRASAELSRLMGILKARLPYKQYVNLQNVTADFRDTDRLIELIGVFAEEFNINMEAGYKNLNSLIQINNLSRQMNPLDLIRETRLLTEKIKTALAYDNTEAEITYLTDFKEHFANYLTASLNSDDWTYVKANLNRFLDIYSKYAAVDDIGAIKKDFAEINAYYDVNTERNNIFISNIINGKPSVSDAVYGDAVSDILKNAKEVKVAVTGGYHSEGLKELLSKRNISSVLITPNVTTDINKANAKYKEIIQRQSKFSKEALAYLIASSAAAIEQQALILGAALRLSEIDGGLLSETIENIKKQGFNVDKRGDGYTISSSENSISLQIKDNAITILTADGEVIDSVDSGMTEEQKSAVIGAAQDILSKVLPSENLFTGFAGLEHDALKTFFYSLYRSGFYFSKGVIAEIEDAGYLKTDETGAEKTLDGMPVGIVSRLPAFMQKMMLKRQQALDIKKQSDIDTENITNILKRHYPHIGETVSIEVLAGGIRERKPHLVTVIKDGKEIKYVLKPIQKAKNTEIRDAGYLSTMVKRLKERGIPLSEVIETSETGVSYIEDGDYFFVLTQYFDEGFAEGSEIRNNPEYFKSIGKMLANFHNSSDSIPDESGKLRDAGSKNAWDVMSAIETFDIDSLDKSLQDSGFEIANFVRGQYETLKRNVNEIKSRGRLKKTHIH
ncbi:MAG: hypothetical protein LBR69_03845, partial [Endomicrobium sp.]|nr:hypothetical protein [Endomicrobium sp.]